MEAQASKGVHVRVIRVVVADDDAAFRGALVDVLEADRRFQVAEAMATGENVVEVLRGVAADLVLLDVRMTDGGPTAARAIREAVEEGRLGGVVVVVLSAQAPVHTVVAMLREGAVGYLVKGRIGSELPDLIARCAAGEVILAVPSGAEALRQLSRAVV
jgi:DNA-binding NarL/FixJ family response regulator